MESSLSEIARRYRELAKGLADPSDVALVEELAAQLANISKLEVSSSDFHLDKLILENLWLKKSLNRLYILEKNSPIFLEILFSELINSSNDHHSPEIWNDKYGN